MFEFLVKKKVSPEDEDDGIAILGPKNNIRVSLLCPVCIKVINYSLRD